MVTSSASVSLTTSHPLVDEEGWPSIELGPQQNSMRVLSMGMLAGEASFPALALASIGGAGFPAASFQVRATST